MSIRHLTGLFSRLFLSGALPCRNLINMAYCVKGPRPIRTRRACGVLIPACFLACQLLVPVKAGSQAIPLGKGNTELRVNEISENYCDQRSLKVTVRSDAKTLLDRQSVAKLHDQKRDTTVFETTSKDSDVVFCGIDFGDYDVEVSAVGYLTDRHEVHVTGTIQQVKLEVILQKDPTAVKLSAADDLIPPKARRDAKHAVDALNSSDPKLAQKYLDKVYKVAPSSAQVNFLYGFLFLELKDFDKSETYLKQAAKLDPRRIQTLTLLGRVQLQRGHYEDARKTLEQAVSSNSQDWLAHNLLGEAYLRLKKYDDARVQAQLAIDNGKSAANAAQLILGQALANVGRDEEGLQALKTFLQADPSNVMAPQVKSLIAEISTRDAEGGGAMQHETGGDPLLAESEPELPPSAWGPPGVDDVKPSVAPGVTCPYDQIVEMTGDRTKQLVDSMAKFSAVEDLLHEQLDKVGNPISKETRKFDYVASIAEERPGFLAVDEYRNERYGLLDLPDHIATTGFVTLALIFHPDMRDNFQFTCEGLGDWHGQPAWILHFQQREDKPNRIESYVMGGQPYRVDQKGRAWIDANNLEIVRIESDLVKPVERLSVQHQIAEYGPVHFQSKNIDLWLPQSADLFLEINRRRYYRRHSFDHYMLFSTNTVDTPGAIKGRPSDTLQHP
jgi:tetratricopeptide (TPR) repeat protein